ncbi:MAG: cytochrome c oxidase assembly protein [Caulobacteraceae bacterium]|nr:cytochrome c oxidase assembly protein [Caulobacteraceae bacterium]
MIARTAALLVLFAPWPATALAHVGGSLDGPVRWTLEPWLVVSLALALLLYGVGAGRLSRRSGSGRVILRRRSLLFALGWLSLAAATVSPLHDLGERSFTAHMIEHEILMLVAAPLLVLARPLGAMVWALPATGRRTVGRVSRQVWVRRPFNLLTAPVTATFIQAAALWLWHAPGLFDLALGHEGWHIAQHLSFLLTALFFWQAMLAHDRGRGLGLAAICLFITSVIAGALGALMAFSQSPWYARYAVLGMAPLGLTPTEDQQMAGLLMWIPGGLVHAGAALFLIGHALHRPAAAAASQSCHKRSRTNGPPSSRPETPTSPCAQSGDAP